MSLVSVGVCGVCGGGEVDVGCVCACGVWVCWVEDVRYMCEGCMVCGGCDMFRTSAQPEKSVSGGLNKNLRDKNLKFLVENVSQHLKDLWVEKDFLRFRKTKTVKGYDYINSKDILY